MDELEIHPRIIAACQRSRLVDFTQILSLSAPDIERLTQLSITDVHTLHQAVAAKAFPNPGKTALELHVDNNNRNLTTGCNIIDKFLHGGIRTGGITEIAGESAAGKTQFCMQLCLTAQLPVQKGGLGAGAIYICTEDVFPNKRLVQMVQRLRKRDPKTVEIPFTDCIFIEHAAEMDDLKFCVNRKLPMLLRQGTVKLVIIDSIAALFRCEYGASETVQRAKHLSSFAAQLHKLAWQHNAAVVCVNQVTSVVSSNQPSSTQVHRGSSSIVPALGLSWANLVTSRLMLSSSRQTVTLTGESGSVDARVRKMEVLFAPHLPNTVCQYVIDADGVKGLD